MRILEVNTLYPTIIYPKTVGGAEWSVRNLSEALVSAGERVEVFRVAPSECAYSVEIVNGVKVHSAPIRNIYWPFTTAHKNIGSRILWHLIDDRSKCPSILHSIIEKFQPDVLHTNNLTGIGTGVWVEARRRRIPVVHTLRDYSLLCPRTKLFKGGQICKSICADCALLTKIRRSRSSLVDAVVGNSDATLGLHLERGLFNDVKIRRSIGSVPAEGAVRLPPRTDEGDSRLVFGFIGRVTEEKGVELLVRTFGRLPQEKFRLRIAGETSPEIQRRLQVEAGGARIEFMGFVKPREFYESVDVVVVPSLWPEPLPRSIIDAIAYGRPVIASCRGGNPEAIGTPPYGVIFDPDEFDGLFNLMSAWNRNGLPREAPRRGDPRVAYQEVFSAVISVK